MPQIKVSDEELRKVVKALRPPSAEVRAAACFRLEAIADSRTVDVQVGVLHNSSEDAQVRNAAASALGTIDGPTVVNKLIEMMREANADDWLTVFSLAAGGPEAGATPRSAPSKASKSAAAQGRRKTDPYESELL